MIGSLMSLHANDRSDDGMSALNRDLETRASNTIFSSRNWPDQHKTDAIQEVMSPFFNIQPLDRRQPLTAYMDISLFGGMVVSHSEFSNHQCIREPSRASAANFESVLVQLFKQGSIHGDAGGNEFHVQQGGIAFFDLSMPYKFQVADSHQTACVNVVLPRFMLEASSVRGLHASVLSPNAAITQLIASHLRSLKNVLPTLDSSEFLAAQQMTVDILDSGFKLFDGAHRVSESSIKEKIFSYISENCEEPLSIDFLADKFHISRATLFRIFCMEGGVATYIKNVRLQRCLRDILFSRRSISINELARKWGFLSEQQLVRSFKKKYNCSPLQLRKLVRQGDFPLDVNNLYYYLSRKSRFE